MLFSSITFLYFFLAVVLAVYFAAPRRCKNAVLLIASLVFYAYGEPRLVVLMVASVLSGYVHGLLIERFRGRPAAKAFLISSVCLSLAPLLLFKYADFIIGNLNALGLGLPLLKLALPIGISFYTFQVLSYTVDVYRGTVKAQRNFIDLATYIALFPQLIAGPIVRYSDVEGALKVRSHSIEAFGRGGLRFSIGLGKKVLLANLLGELCGALKAGDPSVLSAWGYAIALCLQIYFDFSGYSDMAIGLGTMLGFHFPENFNYPFISRSATEFWRRWHMSLGSWFRDYVYIPLGGSRVGIWKQVRNIFVVWVLTGLWHGASWNFAAWGLFFGVLLIAEKLLFGRLLERAPRVLQHIYLLFAALISFLIFDAATLPEAGQAIARLFGGAPLWSAQGLYSIRSYLVVLLLACVGATPLPKRIVERLSVTPWGKRAVSILAPLFMAALIAVSTAYLVDGSFNPFLYFRF